LNFSRESAEEKEKKGKEQLNRKVRESKSRIVQRMNDHDMMT